MSRLADRLRLAADRRGLTVSALADAADVPLRTMQRYMAGETEPTASVLERLREVLAVDGNWLLSGRGLMELDGVSEAEALGRIAEIVGGVGGGARAGAHPAPPGSDGPMGATREPGEPSKPDLAAAAPFDFDPDDALELLWEQHASAGNNHGAVPVASALLEYGRQLHVASRHEEAVEILDTCVEEARSLDSPGLLADALWSRGRALRNLGRWEEAFASYQQARTLYESVKDIAGVARTMAGEAHGLMDRGATPRARQLLEQALPLALESGDPYAIGSCHQTWGLAEYWSGRLPSSATHYWRAVEAYPDEGLKGHALFGLGVALMAAGHLRLAEAAYYTAFTTMRERSARTIAIDALAHVAALRGDAGSYHRRFRVAQHFAHDAAPRDAVQLKYYRAKSLAALGYLEEARKAHEECIAYAKQYGFHRHSEWSTLDLEKLPDPPLSDEHTKEIAEWLQNAAAGRF